jgi:hypothetical protein
MVEFSIKFEEEEKKKEREGRGGEWEGRAITCS